MNDYRAKEMLKVNRRIQKELEVFKSINKDRTLAPAFFKILESKVDGRSLRAYYCFKLYEFLKGRSAVTHDASFFVKKLPFILEVIISIQYYHNQILDGKGGVITHSAINDNLILANLLKDHLYRYIDESVPENYRKLLAEQVRSIFECVDIGQYIEKHYNTYEAFISQEVPDELQNKINKLVKKTYIDEVAKTITNVYTIRKENISYLRTYLQRIYLTNAILFIKTADLVSDLLEVDKRLKNKMERFVAHFGLMQQIVNDNCDFVPSRYNNGTKAKSNKDALCDLKNKCITLPTLIHLQKCPNGAIAQYLKLSDYKFDEEFFFIEIVENWSIFYAMSAAKSLADKMIKEYQVATCTINGFNNLWSVAFNNRFYKHFYRYGNKKVYKDYCKSRKAKQARRYNLKFVKEEAKQNSNKTMVYSKFKYLLKNFTKKAEPILDFFSSYHSSIKKLDPTLIVIFSSMLFIA